MTGRGARRALAGVAIVSATLGTAAMVAGRDTATSDADTASTATTPRRTATVTRRDLARTTTTEGTVGYAGQRPIAGAGGVVTRLPERGATLAAGDTAFDVDGHAGPVVLAGTLPMWRTVAGGVSDGADITQIEGNLAYMGFAPDGLVVDDHFTWSTRQAIRAFQEAHGLARTGELGPGDVWFTPDPVRVADVTVLVGDPAQGPVLTVSSATQIVTTSLEPDQLRYVGEGDAVTLRLPDGSTATAKVTEIADTATVTPGSDGAAATTTIGATITPDRALGTVDGSSVVVELVVSMATDVLAVPVDAVVATAGGRVAVEVVAADGAEGAGGAARLVEITTGAAAEGWVEITGDIAEGTVVVTA